MTDPVGRTRTVTSIYRGRVVHLRKETVCLPNGRETDLEIIRHPGAAAVVPLHDDGTVTLVYQYRHAAGGFIHEIPAGLLEPDEDPMVCAARELGEETGLLATTLTPLLSYIPTPGCSDERIHLFAATGLRAGEMALEPDEVLEPIRMPLDEAVHKAHTGVFVDGKTILALMLVAAQEGLAV